MISPINLTLRGGSLLGLTTVSFISGIITISTNGKKIGEFVNQHSQPVFDFIKKHGSEVGTGIKLMSDKYSEWGNQGFGKDGVITTVFKENFSIDKIKGGFLKMKGEYTTYYGFLSSVANSIFANASSVKEEGKTGIAKLILNFPDRFASLLTTCGGGEGQSISGCEQEGDGIWETFEKLILEIFSPQGDKKEE